MYRYALITQTLFIQIPNQIAIIFKITRAYDRFLWGGFVNGSTH
jgi:hypothetical protein